MFGGIVSEAHDTKPHTNRAATRDLSRINVIIATAYLGLSENMAGPNSIGKSPCSLLLLKFLFWGYTDITPAWPIFRQTHSFTLSKINISDSFPANIMKYPHDTSIVDQFYLLVGGLERL